MRGLPEKIDSKFRYVLLAAARAEQMMLGAQPKDEPGKRKMIRVAMDEVLEDRIQWDYGLPPEPVEDLLAEEMEGEMAAESESEPEAGEGAAEPAAEADA